MRKIIITPILLILIYSLIWFGAAKTVEYKIRDAISGNESEKMQLIGEYEIKVSGFPFDFAIKMSRPHFRLIDKSGNNSGVYDILFNGNFSLSIGWLIKSLDLVSDGGIDVSGVVNGYKFALKADAKKNTHYHIALQDTPLWGEGLQNVLSGNILNLIDQISVKTSGCYINMTSSNQKIFSADEIALEINTDFDGKTKLNIQQHIENAEFTPAAMELWLHLRASPMISNVYSQLGQGLREYLSVFNLPKLGKMNYLVDVSYRAKKDNSDFDLSINKFKLSDNLMQVNLDGTFSSDGDRMAINLRSDSSFTEHWYQLMLVYAKTLKQAKESKAASSVFGRLIGDLRASFAANNSEVYAAYVPRLQSFDQIHNKAKLIVKTKGDGYESVIEELSFVTKPYSVMLSGEFVAQSNRQSYDIDLDLKNYSLVVNDAFSYAQRITNAVGKGFFIGDNALALTEQTRTQFGGFLKQVSNSPNSNSTDMTISAKKSLSQTYPEVGKYDSQAFGLMWNHFIATTVINETADKIKQFLPEKMQNKLQKHLDEGLAPLNDLLSLMK